MKSKNLSKTRKPGDRFFFQCRQSICIALLKFVDSGIQTPVMSDKWRIRTTAKRTGWMSVRAIFLYRNSSSVPHTWLGLIPCDDTDEHDSRKITDNVRRSTAHLSRRFHRVNRYQELRRHLVDALPIGSSLVVR